MDSLGTFPESPMEQEDVVYPCKGCGEILEEGKAFELAGNRWHIDCFRCNTCGTLLDSDANLLLLGDGSLICNNCTYSCSACGNKIEDLAILTGEQAFCASCFRCRNCKRKIENLRYARTSQGIFCMSCHESLMARRRKKSKAARQASSQQNGAGLVLDKSLPALPPSAATQAASDPTTDVETPSGSYDGTPLDMSPLPRPTKAKKEGLSEDNNRIVSPASTQDSHKKNLTLPASTYKNNRHSMILMDRDNPGGGAQEGLLVPFALDTNATPEPSPGARATKPGKSLVIPEFGKVVDSRPSVQDYFDSVMRTSSRQDSLRDYRSVSSRTPSTERGGQTVHTKPPASPHIAYQERGHQSSQDSSDISRKARGQSATSSVVASPDMVKDQDQSAESPSFNLNSFGKGGGFKLQEVPKQKKAGTLSSRVFSENKQGAVPSPSVDAGKSRGQIEPARTPSPTSGAHTPPSHSPYENKRFSDSPSSSHFARSIKEPTPAFEKPKRGDSLNAPPLKQTLQTKDNPLETTHDVSTPVAQSKPGHERTLSSPSAGTNEMSRLNGGRTISKPIESPTLRSLLDAPIPPSRASGRQTASGNASTMDSFTAPRAPPPPPPSNIERHKANESISTQSDHSRDLAQPHSPLGTLPRYSAGGEFSMDEDMARIMRGEDTSENASSVLRRVSNAVSKHGRSFSDRGSRSSTSARWKGPATGSIDITSPTSASPDSKEEASQLRNHLRRAQQRIAELEAEKNGLQEKVNSSVDIKHMNTELKEKRSTVAFLDTQREMVVRELEIMTDHLAKAKESNKPLDFSVLKSEILQDFAMSLQKLKDSLSHQLEDLVHKRNELTDEISSLIQMKDKGFQEYESLTTKNTQLAEVHAHLVHNIQEMMYKAGRHPNGGSTDSGRLPANGLGIYSHSHDDKSEISMDLRGVLGNDASLASMLQDHDSENHTVLPAPQVVNIRKGQPKKFNWKKGGHVVAKNVTKGLNRAFASTQYPSREGSSREGQHVTEGTPYGSLPSASDSTTSGGFGKPSGDPSRAGFGFFAQKSNSGKANQIKQMSNNSSTNLNSGDSSSLFGSELHVRCDIEKRVIPTIVSRCIEEVELRGMDMEGIYRKSGGAGQVKLVQAGFEKNLDHDISDPDLDIHAVTSALKQYFRKLPTPLITYDVYDQLLEAARVQDLDRRVQALRAAIDALPRSHHDCLEFLIFHLARVVENESDNLMTPLNLAVVFAPTIMRPLSVEREMADMQCQRMAVQAILENNKAIFGA